jgi:PEP-CTERM motif-containing protein
MKRLIALTSLSVGMAMPSMAGVALTFQNFAPAGGLANVSPTSPYMESGFTLTPSNANSAVFSSTDPTASFPGDSTDWFGFAAGNSITLTGPIPFSLTSLLVGPSSLGSGTISFTIVGNVVGGGTDMVTFGPLTTATLESVGFTNLQSAVFTTTSDTGIDNVSLTAAPEPASFFLMGTAALLTFGLRRKFVR